MLDNSDTHSLKCINVYLQILTIVSIPEDEGNECG